MPITDDSIQIYLNSKYASMKPNGGDTGFCMFEYPNIVFQDGRSIYLSLVSAVIPYSFYSINSNNNGVHIEDASGGTYTFSVTPGNYNIYQLRTEILAQMGGGWDLSYNPVTNKVTFDLSASIASGFTIYSDGTLNHALGFSETTNTVSTAGQAISETCVNLNQIRAINMEIDMPTPSINVAQPLNQNILATIPVTTQPYGMILWDNPNGYKVNMYCEKMNMIKVKFIDNLGNLINMNGVNWQATIQIDVENLID